MRKGTYLEKGLDYYRSNHGTLGTFIYRYELGNCRSAAWAGTLPGGLAQWATAGCQFTRAWLETHSLSLSFRSWLTWFNYAGKRWKAQDRKGHAHPLHALRQQRIVNWFGLVVGWAKSAPDETNIVEWVHCAWIQFSWEALLNHWCWFGIWGAWLLGVTWFPFFGS